MDTEFVLKTKTPTKGRKIQNFRLECSSKITNSKHLLQSPPTSKSHSSILLNPQKPRNITPNHFNNPKNNLLRSYSPDGILSNTKQLNFLQLLKLNDTNTLTIPKEKFELVGVPVGSDKKIQIRHVEISRDKLPPKHQNFSKIGKSKNLQSIRDLKVMKYSAEKIVPNRSKSTNHLQAQEAKKIINLPRLDEGFKKRSVEKKSLSICGWEIESIN